MFTIEVKSLVECNTMYNNTYIILIKSINNCINTQCTQYTIHNTSHMSSPSNLWIKSLRFHSVNLSLTKSNDAMRFYYEGREKWYNLDDLDICGRRYHITFIPKGASGTTKKKHYDLLKQQKHMPFSI